jgi:mono/diheme cytochrome c family protein
VGFLLLNSLGVAGLAVLAAAALPLATLAVAAHVSVRPMDIPLHSLADEPRARAAPTTGPGAAGSPDTAAGRVAVLLAERCAACHGAHEPAAGVRADTPGALRAEQNGVRWVLDGRPDESRLFSVVGVQAETPKHRLTQIEIDAVRAWIAAL